MPISHREDSSLTCPRCHGRFRADVWLILDAQEHPEQREALREGQLDIVTCPHCGQSSPAHVPFLFHDASARRVIFAAPPGVPEYIWREQARELHALLVGSIPLDERRSYLGDVEIAQDIAGVAHMLKKSAQRQTAAQAAPPSSTPAPRAEQQVNRVPQREPPPEPAPAAPDISGAQSDSLLTAVEALMTIGSLAELSAIVEEHPILRTAQADIVLGQLADVAFEQRQYELAEGLRQARTLLARLRADEAAAEPGPTDTAPPATEIHREPVGQPVREAAPPDLPYDLYQVLFQIQHSEELQQLVDAHPLLLEPWVDAALTHAINQMADEGSEALAAALEQRREALGELRQRMAEAAAAAEQERAPIRPPSPTATDQTIAQEAIEALLLADDDEARAQVLIDYEPVIFTDEVQQLLWQLSSYAQSQGDEELATAAVECRAMLRKVREGLADENA